MPDTNIDGKSEPATVTAQVQRILHSQVFAGSEQLKRFLSVAVARALNGQPEHLKEYSLGVEVFGRPESYDPKLDPIVRVQARRLRAKLQEYYDSEGLADPLLIQLPKGGYLPAFEKRPAAAKAFGKNPENENRLKWVALAVLVLGAVVWIWTRGLPAPASFSVAVLPLENLTGDPGKQFLADKTTEALITELAKNPNLRVISRTTAMRYGDSDNSLPEIAHALRVRSIVEGGVGMEGDQVLLKIRAVDGKNDHKIWAQSYASPPDQLSAIHVEAAQALSAAILEATQHRQNRSR